jgi:hypothetical protein
VSLIDWKRYHGWELKKHLSVQREVLRCVVDELIMNFYVNEATVERAYWYLSLTFSQSGAAAGGIWYFIKLLFINMMAQKNIQMKNVNLSWCGLSDDASKAQKIWNTPERACHFYVENLHQFYIAWWCVCVRVCRFGCMRSSNQLPERLLHDLGMILTSLKYALRRRAVPQRRGIIIAKGIKYPWLEAKCSGASERECALVLWK